MHTPGKRILLAEDDRFLRKAAEATLARFGFSVLPATDGDEAVRLARTERPDLILLDLIMPKRHGFDVLRELKGDPATASIPVIVLSTLGQESDVQRALESGAVDYLVKSALPLRELARRVAERLGQGTPA